MRRSLSVVDYREVYYVKEKNSLIISYFIIRNNLTEILLLSEQMNFSEVLDEKHSLVYVYNILLGKPWCTYYFEI